MDARWVAVLFPYPLSMFNDPLSKVVGDWALPAAPLYDYYGWDPAVEHDKAAAGLEAAWVAVRKAAVAGAEVMLLKCWGSCWPQEVSCCCSPLSTISLELEEERCTLPQKLTFTLFCFLIRLPFQMRSSVTTASALLQLESTLRRVWTAWKSLERWVEDMPV